MRFLLFLVVSGVGVSQIVTVTANRLTSAPILSPRPGWMSLGVFNPAATKLNGKTILLFRAQDDRHTSRIGYAESTDGLHFTVRQDPVLSPQAEYEKNGGVEDPRLLNINGTYYLTYTGYDGHAAATLFGHLEGSDSLGPEGSDPTRLQRHLERTVDEVRRHCSKSSSWEMVDVLFGDPQGCRREDARSHGLGAIERSGALAGCDEGTRFA